MNWHNKEEAGGGNSALLFRLGRSRHCLTIKKSSYGSAWIVDIDDQVICSIPKRIKTPLKRRHFALAVLRNRCDHYRKLGEDIDANSPALKG
jgi:hypothetical protein